MRLDKFLKVSRLIKRRTIAKSLADAGRIEVNGRVAKSSSTINIGDILLIHLGQKDLKVKILDINELANKNNSKEMYVVLE